MRRTQPKKPPPALGTATDEGTTIGCIAGATAAGACGAALIGAGSITGLATTGAAVSGRMPLITGSCLFLRSLASRRRVTLTSSSGSSIIV